MKIADEIVQEFGSLLPFKTTQGLKYSEIEKALSKILPKLMITFPKLEWVAGDDISASKDYHEAKVLGITYCVLDGVCSVLGEDGVVFHGAVGEDDLAKAAAQTDYEHRMLKGLGVQITPTYNANYILSPIERLPSDGMGKCGWTDISDAINESYRRFYTLPILPDGKEFSHSSSVATAARALLAESNKSAVYYACKGLSKVHRFNSVLERLAAPIAEVEVGGEISEGRTHDK